MADQYNPMMNQQNRMMDPNNQQQMGDTMKSNGTMTTNARKQYPKDAVGIKDEWHALVQHQVELHAEIQKREKELKFLQGKQYLGELDAKMAQHLAEQQNELLIKQKEAEIMDIKMQEYQRENQRWREHKQTVQGLLHANYENDMQNRNKNLWNQKMSRLDEEKRAIEENQRRMDEENKKKTDKVAFYQNMLQNDMKAAEAQRQLQYDMQARDKDDYKDMMKRNEQKQMVKEMNYRNFYKMTAENQKSLEDIHRKVVLSPEMEKQKARDDMVQRGIEEVNQRNIDKELAKKRLRDELSADMQGALASQVTYKDYLAEMEKLQKKYGKEEVLKQLMDYQTFLVYQRGKKQQNQNLYKDMLDKQTQENEEKWKLNKMTKEEKKLNFDDLQAYKDSQTHTLYTLVPGYHKMYHHFKGSNPNSPQLRTFGGGQSQDLKQNGESGNGFLDAASSPQQRQFNNNPNQPAGMAGMGTQNLNDQLGRYGPQQSSSPDVRGPPKDYTNNTKVYSSVNLNPAQQNNIFSVTYSQTKGHNPVTNPLPFNVQNPYILKEIEKLKVPTSGNPNVPDYGRNRSSYLGQIASNNLVKN
jgi:hypothetical protein